MKKITSLVFGLLLITAFIVPTFANASTYTTQSHSSNGSFLSFSLSDLLSIFSSNNNRSIQSYNNNNININNNNYRNNGNWWDCFWDWMCSANKGDNEGGWNNGGDWNRDQCQNDKSGFNNDHGCIGSDEVWKKWFCY